MKTNAARGDGVVLTCCCRAPGCSASSLLLDRYLAVSDSDPSGSQRSPPSGMADELQLSRAAAHLAVPGPAPAALYLHLGPAPDPAGGNTDQTQAGLYRVSSSVPPTLVYRSLAPSDPGSISGWLGFRPRPASTSDRSRPKFSFVWAHAIPPARRENDQAELLLQIWPPHWGSSRPRTHIRSE